MWHHILGRTFQSINTEFIKHTHTTLNTVHANGFQFLEKYSQPQNILCIKYTYQIKKDKGHPRTGHECPPSPPLKWRDIALLSILGARLGWVVATPRPGGKETQYPLYRKLGGPRAGLDRRGKSCSHQDSNPGPPTTCNKSLYRLCCFSPHIHIRRWVMPNVLIKCASIT